MIRRMKRQTKKRHSVESWTRRERRRALRDRMFAHMVHFLDAPSFGRIAQRMPPNTEWS